MKLNKPQISDLWFKIGEWVKAHVVIFVCMYTNAVANNVMLQLYIWHDFYTIFKIKQIM
jgi:hypothetical protein